jgi:fumarylacetoacetate (FAA) hydrolase family protein
MRRQSLAPPLRSDFRKDEKPLLDALASLQCAHEALKIFKKTNSVVQNRVVETELRELRRRLKKLRQRADFVAGRWRDLATDVDK